MGLFDRLKGDGLKAVAKQALNGISLEDEKLSAFTPFLQIFDAEGRMQKLNCVAPTNEAAQDLAYEMITHRCNRDPAAIDVYALVFIGNYDPEIDSLRPLIAECGAAGADKAVLYGIAFKADSEGFLQRRPGVFRIRETANALHGPKSFALRTVMESGGFVNTYMARIPLVLTYLTAFELGTSGARIPSEAWELYRGLLEDWSQRQTSVGYLMAAFSLQAIAEKRVEQLMPREGITVETMRSALHTGAQILVEGVRNGRIDREDLNLIMKELSLYVVKLTGFLNDGDLSEKIEPIVAYLDQISRDPLTPVRV